MFAWSVSTVLLRQSVKESLRIVSGLKAVYPKKAPATQSPPYVVFLLDLMTKEENIAQYQLSIYVSGYGADDAPIEELSDKIQFGMDYSSYQDERMAWDCYLTGRQDVDSADKNIVCRRLDFTLRYIGGKNYETV